MSTRYSGGRIKINFRGIDKKVRSGVASFVRRRKRKENEDQYHDEVSQNGKDQQRCDAMRIAVHSFHSIHGNAAPVEGLRKERQSLTSVVSVPRSVVMPTFSLVVG